MSTPNPSEKNFALPKERKSPMPDSSPVPEKKQPAAAVNVGRMKGHHNIVNGKSHGEKMRHS